MKTIHTPGPWSFEGCGLSDGGRATFSGSESIYSQGGRVIAQMRVEVGNPHVKRLPIMADEIFANCRLIASAPDLLEALKALEPKFSQIEMYGGGEAVAKALQAIAKAEGKS